MHVDIVRNDSQTRVIFRIERPHRIAIDLVIPLSENDRGLFDAVTELYAVVDYCRYCDCSPESCLDCKVHQIITLIRRCTENLSPAARAHVALTVVYDDGSRKNLATIDEPEGVAARLMDRIKGRGDAYGGGQVAAASGGDTRAAFAAR